LPGYLSRKQNLIIYMSDVRHVDSAGAATLLDIYAIARGVAPGFALVAISRNVLHTFSRCCLDGVLPLFEHIGEAKKHLRELPGT
jgi:anti-anti-sigma factor